MHLVEPQVGIHMESLGPHLATGSPRARITLDVMRTRPSEFGKGFVLIFPTGIEHSLRFGNSLGDASQTHLGLSLIKIPSVMSGFQMKMFDIILLSTGLSIVIYLKLTSGASPPDPCILRGRCGWDFGQFEDGFVTSLDFQVFCISNLERFG